MIRFENIKISFTNNNIFEDFNLTINRGEKVLIYGKSGIGKSVLFKLLLGLIQPEKGTVYFDDKLLDGKTVWDVRKKISYVSQDVDIASGNVFEIIKDIFSIKANSHLELVEDELLELMDQFELKRELLDKDLSHLSGGERQRIAIVVAILLKRDVFLLDEVTAALDSNLKDKVINYFTHRSDWTVLVISHDKDWLENKYIKIFNLEEKLWKHQI